MYGVATHGEHEQDFGYINYNVNNGLWRSCPLVCHDFNFLRSVTHFSIDSVRAARQAYRCNFEKGSEKARGVERECRQTR